MRRFGAVLVGGLWAAGLWTAASGAALAQEIPYTARAVPAPGQSDCPGGLCQPEALADFFTALAAMEDGARGAPVHVLQLGDSHTAGDRITGAVRATLQARFGVGGRGVLPAGVPYHGYAPLQVRVEAEDWTSTPAPPAFPAGGQMVDVGLAGMQPPRFGRTPVLRITPDPGAEPSVLRVCARVSSRETEFHVMSSGRWIHLPLRQVGRGPSCMGLRLGSPGQGPPGPIELRPHGAEALPYSVMLDSERPGVILSNLGVVEATLRDLAARDDAVAAVELAMWRPSLIVLAFGANEGFDPTLDGAAYETLLGGQITRMRRLAPGASLLILGAPDALRSGSPGGCSADGLRAPPPSLAVVRDVQRRVAADLGVTFWDWHGRMGGDCSADRLALEAEPLMRGDRVHFTSAGADWIGGILAADLMAAFEAWKAGQGGAE
jgi:lysophospholipase L1-like esterase